MPTAGIFLMPPAKGKRCFLGGIVHLIYQRDNRPILITPRHASIICLCRADQACANQAPGHPPPNQRPIDDSSYLSHCMRRDTGGNRANGRGLKVTLFTSPMTGQYIWGEIWAPLCPTRQHVCIKVKKLTPHPLYRSSAHMTRRFMPQMRVVLAYTAPPYCKWRLADFFATRSFFFSCCLCERLMWPRGFTSEMLSAILVFVWEQNRRSKAPKLPELASPSHPGWWFTRRCLSFSHFSTNWVSLSLSQLSWVVLDTQSYADQM